MYTVIASAKKAEVGISLLNCLLGTRCRFLSGIFVQPKTP